MSGTEDGYVVAAVPIKSWAMRCPVEACEHVNVVYHLDMTAIACQGCGVSLYLPKSKRGGS